MPRIPLTWLAEHVELPAGLTAEQLAADLVRVGLEEEAIHAAAVTGPLVVGEVVELTPEPQKNGKTINWCRVDVGAEHNEPGGAPRGIVCGAHNFVVGDRVVVALPGAVLPGPFAIASRKTYGHVSDGMICSARELGLGEDHAGIIVLSELGLDAPVGTDARELLGLGEEVLEINVTPDRGYCFSMRGVAREYGLSTGAAFTDHGLPSGDERPAGGGFAVEIDDAAPIHGVPGADRFVAQIVRGVRANDPSPAWMQRRLQQAGMRPISLAVDVTNYVMLDLGQPLHAYDLAHLVRADRGATREPGGADPDPRRRRPRARPRGPAHHRQPGRGARCPAHRSGGRHGRRRQRGERDDDRPAHRGRPLRPGHGRADGAAPQAAQRGGEAVRAWCRPASCRRVAVARTVALLVEHGGGVAGPLTDVDRRVPVPSFELALDLPARLVGLPFTADEVRETLRSIGCDVADAGADAVTVTAPSWRPDLVAGVDLVEEVARLRGYDAIPSTLPVAPGRRGPDGGPAGPSLDRAARWPRPVSSRCSATRSSGPTSSTRSSLPADDDRRRAVRLVNPLSDEQPYLRTNLLVTLLDTARRNVSRGDERRGDLRARAGHAAGRGRARGAAAAGRGAPVRRGAGGDRRRRAAAAAPGRRRARGPAGARRLVGARSPGRPHRRDRGRAPGRGRRRCRAHGVGRRRPRAVAPGSVRATDDGRRHPGRPRGRAAPERRDRARPAGPCGGVRARPGRAARGGVARPGPGGAGLDVPGQQGGRRPRGRRRRSPPPTCSTRSGSARRRARSATSSRRSGCSTCTRVRRWARTASRSRSRCGCGPPTGR